MLHQPDAVLRQRVMSPHLFGEFLPRIEQTVKEYLEALPESDGRTCSIVVALKPNHKSRFWIEYYPVPLPPEDHAALLEALGRLDVPDIQGGPVSFAMFGLMWGGIGREKDPHFRAIPQEWHTSDEGVIPDAPLAKVWSDD